MREDIFDNRLIFGDNLLALKALEQEFTGKVKCVFIDPPFNTGGAFEYMEISAGPPRRNYGIKTASRFSAI